MQVPTRVDQNFLIVEFHYKLAYGFNKVKGTALRK